MASGRAHGEESLSCNDVSATLRGFNFRQQSICAEMRFAYPNLRAACEALNLYFDGRARAYARVRGARRRHVARAVLRWY
jgi:hypothetical protein